VDTPETYFVANHAAHDESRWQLLCRTAPEGRQAQEDLLHRDLTDVCFKAAPELVQQPPAGQELEYIALQRLIDNGVTREIRSRTRYHGVYSFLAAKELAREVRGLATKIGQWKAAKSDLGGIDNADRQAAVAVTQTLDDARSALLALGLEESQGRGTAASEDTPLDRNYLTSAFQFMQYLENARFLQFFEWIGRLQTIHRKSRSERWTKQPQLLVGVEQGQAVMRQTPYQLAFLTTPLLLPLWQKDFCERRLQQYRLRGRETPARGPFIGLLDCSGSMNGNRYAWGCAVLLMLCQQAASEQRDFWLLLFDTDTYGQGFVGRAASLYQQQHPSPPTTQTWQPWAFPQGQPNPAHFLEIFGRPPNGGGTDGYQALQAAWQVADQYPATRDADVVLITDGYAGMSKKAAEIRQENAARQLRLWVVLAEGGSTSEAESVTDPEYVVPITNLQNLSQQEKAMSKLVNI
jgi:uncharacterized protein with von Willebrand factor type A (vWA) domain